MATPQRRPPTAKLFVFDDDLEDGEWVRLRLERTVVGRTGGHVLVPHDAEMSGEHFEIRRCGRNDQVTWTLRDLDSENGTYVRIADDSILRHGAELIIGSGRFRFEIVSVPVRQHEPDLPADGSKTVAWHSNRGTQGAQPRSALVEYSAAGECRRFPLSLAKHVFGSHPSRCTDSLDGDDLVEPEHLCITKTPAGWMVSDRSTINFVWERVREETALSGPTHLLAGEQRFLFLPPHSTT